MIEIDSGELSASNTQSDSIFLVPGLVGNFTL